MTKTDNTGSMTNATLDSTDVYEHSAEGKASNENGQAVVEINKSTTESDLAGQEPPNTANTTFNAEESIKEVDNLKSQSYSVLEYNSNMQHYAMKPPNYNGQTLERGKCATEKKMVVQTVKKFFEQSGSAPNKVCKGM